MSQTSQKLVAKVQRVLDRNSNVRRLRRRRELSKRCASLKVLAQRELRWKPRAPGEPYLRLVLAWLSQVQWQRAPGDSYL